MKAEELRIGNWVKLGNNSLFKPEFIGSYYQFTIGDFVHAEYYQPIPLTPEILEKAATKTEGSVWTFDLPEVKRVIVISWYDKEQKRVWHNGNYIGILHLQYVHELQNLIRALTSSELPINL